MIRYECTKCEHPTYSETFPVKCSQCDNEKFFWGDRKSSSHRCEDCCDCENCEDADHPCHGDCDVGHNQCYGCYLSDQEREEIQYEIDVAQGKY